MTKKLSGGAVARLEDGRVGASLEVMERDTKKMRGARPYIFANIRAGAGVAAIADFIVRAGGLTLHRPGDAE